MTSVLKNFVVGQPTGNCPPGGFGWPQGSFSSYESLMGAQQLDTIQLLPKFLHLPLSADGEIRLKVLVSFFLHPVTK